MADSIEIRLLYTLNELKPAVELQRVYWGEDVESVIPAHMLFSLANYGGHVLAAMDGDKMVGVLVGFLGTSMDEPERPAMANLQLVSKRMVILPEYRNRGLAYRLKVAQREMAIKQGVRLVTWTFDPLLAPNAHLNIRKLGAICQEFRENYYGTESSGGLATMGYSDRLFVEWWVTNRRVKERIEGNRGNLELIRFLEGGAVILNPTGVSQQWPTPCVTPLAPASAVVLVEIPTNFPALMDADARLAEQWRVHIRGMFRLLIGSYMVTDFVRETYEGRDRCFYVLTYRSPQFDPGLN
ncbi:MAG: hypothetical protein K8L99_00040 [Anaerolineae bacterium]|nr:hypothetical protein [Anaerolineae bacterium]